MQREEEGDESDGDEGTILKKCLNVALPKNFNPNQFPENGEQYVQLVMYEAKRCKKCVRADIDISKFEGKQTVTFEQKEVEKAPPTMRPTEEWQQEKLQKFTEFRKFVLSKVEEPLTNHAIHPSHWENKIINNFPTFHEVANLTQESKLKLLTIISDHLDDIEEGETFNSHTGTWIYALLSTFEIPLSPEICHEFRDLARRCAFIRSRLREDATSKEFIPLNLFICLISNYFKQLDLKD